jgi:hypothetical protein
MILKVDAQDIAVEPREFLEPLTPDHIHLGIARDVMAHPNITSS